MEGMLHLLSEVQKVEFWWVWDHDLLTFALASLSSRSVSWKSGWKSTGQLIGSPCFDWKIVAVGTGVAEAAVGTAVVEVAVVEAAVVGAAVVGAAVVEAAFGTGVAEVAVVEAAVGTGVVEAVEYHCE